MSQNPHCKYHPKEVAIWFCKHCDVYSCIDCVPKKNNDVFPNCTLCRRSLQSLSIAANIPVFWSRLAFFFLLPIQKTLFMALLVFAVFASFIPSGKIGMVFSILLVFPIGGMLFELMESVANGEPTEQNLKKILYPKNISLLLKPLFTFGFLGLLIIKSFDFFGPGFGYTIGAFFVLGIPASLIVLMMEKQFVSMISPIKIIYIIKLFGAAYFLLYAIALASGSISLLFNGAAVSETSNLLALLIANLLALYLLSVLFSMMGYLVFQHHFELNYSVRSSNLQSIRKKKISAMTEVEIFIQEGRFEDAEKLLADKIAKNGNDYKAYEKLILLYAIQEKESAAFKVTDAYFNHLIAKDKKKQAADFYQRLYDKSIDYTPKEVSLALSISSVMNNREQFQCALAILGHYDCQPTGEKLWDSIALMKAKLIAEFKHDISTASELLRLIIKRSVDQAILDSAEKYLAVIQLAESEP